MRQLNLSKIRHLDYYKICEKVDEFREWTDITKAELTLKKIARFYHYLIGILSR